MDRRPEGELTPPPQAKHRSSALLAQIRVETAAACGLRDRAMQALRDADALGVMDVAWRDRCPVLEPLRHEPTFLDVREHVGQRARAVVEAYLAEA